jgi:hypothetical protein
LPKSSVWPSFGSVKNWFLIVLSFQRLSNWPNSTEPEGLTSTGIAIGE